jgi:hypothetical protein
MYSKQSPMPRPEYFNGPRIARIDRDLRRHAFVAVGWGRENDDSEFLPHMVPQTFLYVPADDRQGIVYGPTVVSGGAVLADFMAGSLDAPEMADLKRAVEASQKAESS